MSETKISLEQIINKYNILNFTYTSKNCLNIEVKKAMIEFGKQILELAAENANMIGETQHNNRAPDVFEDFVYVSDSNGPDYGYTVNKQSILDTIKQVR